MFRQGLSAAAAPFRFGCGTPPTVPMAAALPPSSPQNGLRRAGAGGWVGRHGLAHQAATGAEMQLDKELIKDALDVAFPGAKTILCIAEDAQDQSYAYINIHGKDEDAHQRMMENAIESVVQHMHKVRGVDIDKLYETEEAKYWHIVAIMTLAIGANYVKRSFECDDNPIAARLGKEALDKLNLFIKILRSAYRND